MANDRDKIWDEVKRQRRIGQGKAEKHLCQLWRPSVLKDEAIDFNLTSDSPGRRFQFSKHATEMVQAIASKCGHLRHATSEVSLGFLRTPLVLAKTSCPDL